MLRHIYFFLLYLPVCYASPITNIELARQLTSVDEAEPWEGDSSWQANIAEGWGLPDDTDRLLPSVQSVDFHFGASNTEYILKRSFVANVTSDGLAVRVIRTPWPMVVGQTIFSLLMAWFGLKPGNKPLEKPPLYTQIIWFANILRATAAVVYLVIHFATGERDVPSVGEAIIFGTVLGGSYQFNNGNVAKFASYFGVFISFAGTLLYIAMGILAWVSNGFLMPCPSAGSYSDCGVLYATPLEVVPCLPIMWQQTGGDWEYLAAWLAGALWYGFFIITVVLLDLNTCQFHGGNGWANTLKQVNFYGMVIVGLSACIGAVLSAISPSPSSVSGFWDLWAQNKARVVESLFTW